MIVSPLIALRKDPSDQCELCQLMKGVAPRDYNVN